MREEESNNAGEEMKKLQEQISEKVKKDLKHKWEVGFIGGGGSLPSEQGESNRAEVVQLSTSQHGNGERWKCPFHSFYFLVQWGIRQLELLQDYE